MNQDKESPFSILLQSASEQFERILRRFNKEKSILFVDPDLTIAVGRVIHPSKIERAFSGIFTYEGGYPAKEKFEKIAIFTSGHPAHLKTYFHIFLTLPQFPDRFIFFFVNKRTIAIQEIIDQSGLIDLIQSFELHLSPFVLDYDSATFHIPRSFQNSIDQNLFLENTLISEYFEENLNHKYLTNTFAIGANSIQILKKLGNLLQTGWSHLIFYDRSTDLVTPFFLLYHTNLWLLKQ